MGVGQVLCVKLHLYPSPASGQTQICTWVSTMSETAGEQSGPCPSRLPHPCQPQAVFLKIGLTVHGGKMRLVARTKERHQKLNRC